MFFRQPAPDQIVSDRTDRIGRIGRIRRIGSDSMDWIGFYGSDRIGWIGSDGSDRTDIIEQLGPIGSDRMGVFWIELGEPENTEVLQIGNKIVLKTRRCSGLYSEIPKYMEVLRIGSESLKNKEVLRIGLREP